MARGLLNIMMRRPLTAGCGKEKGKEKMLEEKPDGKVGKGVGLDAKISSEK